MAVRIRGRRPVDLATRRRPGPLDQGDAADLVVSLGREPRPNQLTTIIEQEHGIAAGSQMNARGLAIIGVGGLASGRRSQSLLSGTLCAPFFRPTFHWYRGSALFSSLIFKTALLAP